MKMLDPKVEYITAHADIVGIVTSYFPEWELDGLVQCPFHDDIKASLHISDTGKAYCHSGSCSASAKDIVTLVAMLEGSTPRKVRDMLYRDIVNAIPESQVDALHRYLLRDRAALKYLTEDRNISLAVLEEFRIGLDPTDRRITVPVVDMFGSCVNMRRIKWKGSNGVCDEKVINIKGRGEIRLFPEPYIAMERRLLLVEGELDCLCARSFNLPSVTWTGGCGNWNHKYEQLFKAKGVWVRYDTDTAGNNAMLDVVQHLQQITPHVFPVDPPKGVTPAYKDITDWSLIREHRPWFSELKEEIELYKFPRRKAKAKICPHCGQEMK